MKKYFTLILALQVFQICISQDCIVDKNFGVAGIGSMTDGTYGSRNLLVQPDGKIIQAAVIYIGSNYSLALQRYNANGRPDSSFGYYGVVFELSGGGWEPKAIALQQDGKIMVAGDAINSSKRDFSLKRFNPNGSPDVSFGVNGRATTSVGTNNDYTKAVHIQPDGKILVVGSTYTLDSTGCYGYYYTSINAAVRFQPDGKVDSSFGDFGKLKFSISDDGDDPIGITTQADGKILVASAGYYDCYCDYYYGGYYCSSSFLAITRFTASGVMDATYGINGVARDSAFITYPTAIALQPDGKLLVTGTGSLNGFKMERFNSNGTRDNSFGTGGTVRTLLDPDGQSAQSFSIAINTDGKIVVGGNFGQGDINGFGFARYNSAGLKDSSFTQTGTAIVSLVGNEYQTLTSVAFQGTKIIAGGDMYNSSAFAGIIRLADSIPSLGAIITPGGDISVCAGQPFRLTATAVGEFQWFRNGVIIPGATDSIYEVNISGVYSVMVSNAAGCGISNYANLTFVPSPPQPYITTRGNVLHYCDGGNVLMYANSAGTFKWYLNNNLIAGAQADSFAAASPGVYKVSATNAFGCTRSSDTVVVTHRNGIPKPSIAWSGKEFRTDPGFAHYQWYHNNNVLPNETSVIFKPALDQVGEFKVRVSDDGGCTNVSDSFILIVTGVSDIVIGDAKLRYYPNPVSTRLIVELPDATGKKFTTELFDLGGRLVKSGTLQRGRNEINVADLPAGIYSFVIRNEREKRTLKIIVSQQ